MINGKASIVKVIVILLILGLVWQQTGWGDTMLRPRAVKERKGLSLKEFLRSFGIEVFMIQRRVIFRRVPLNVDWVMDKMRSPEKGPIVTAKGTSIEIEGKMPVAKLIYPIEEIEELPPIPGEGSNSRGLYMGLIEWAGEIRPAAIKLFKKYTWDHLMLQRVQELSYLGTNPRFYGVVKNAGGEIIGYAMQLVIGDVISGPTLMTQEGGPSQIASCREISRRTRAVGLNPPREYMITRIKEVVGIDADDLETMGSRKEAHADFIRRMNEPEASI